MKLQFVLEKYGIRPRGNFPFSYFSMGNEVFFLRDEKKNRRLVLKNCLKNRSRDLLAVEARVIDHLRAHGCGAPEVVPALDGSPFVEYNGDFWIMYGHLKGRTPTWRTRLRTWHLRGAVTGLATYHKAISNLDPAVDTGRIRSYQHDRVLAWTEALAAELAADTSGRTSVDKMRTLIPAYVDLARSMADLLPAEAVARCEELMIHGDFHSFNSMYRGFRFSACFDFDFLRRDLKLADVVWTLRFIQNRFYRKRYGEAVRKPGFEAPLDEVRQIEAQALLWFVKVYNRTYRLTRDEVALLPGMQAALALYNLRFFSLKHSEEECLDHHGWFDWQLKKIQRTEEAYRAAVDDVLKDGSW
jgi:Ser/Thr protein kinase RdoA (MazF antagonist)